MTADQTTTDIKSDELLWKCPQCNKVYAVDYVGNFKGYVPAEISTAYRLRGYRFRTNDDCYPCFMKRFEKS